MGREHLPEGEEPHGRIEIIPPSDQTEDANFNRIWMSNGSGSVKIVKLGPFAGVMLFLVAMLVIALVFALFTGAFLILFPIGVLLGAGAWLSGLLGGKPFRRLK